jgi:hypothetical protein
VCSLRKWWGHPYRQIGNFVLSPSSSSEKYEECNSSGWNEFELQPLLVSPPTSVIWGQWLAWAGYRFPVWLWDAVITEDSLCCNMVTWDPPCGKFPVGDSPSINFLGSEVHVCLM